MHKSDWIFPLFHIDLLPTHLFILGHTKTRYKAFIIKLQLNYTMEFTIYCHRINVLSEFHHHCRLGTFVSQSLIGRKKRVQTASEAGNPKQNAIRCCFHTLALLRFYR